jgi:thioredoxin-dependent peroxiredoxin
MLKVGDKAPAFSLPDETGNVVALKDLRGKKVVLYFYPKDMTPGCTKEACDFNDSLARIRRKGAVVIGISADRVATHMKFKEKYSLGFPLLSDEQKEVAGAYGVWQQKKFLGKKYMGIVRSTFIIDEQGTITHMFPRVSVLGHAEEVLSLL